LSKVANGTQIKRIRRVVADNKIRVHPPNPLYLRSIGTFNTVSFKIQLSTNFDDSCAAKSPLGDLGVKKIIKK